MRAGSAVTPPSPLNAEPRTANPLPAQVLDVACAWELFHAFLLCHDDIIDGADTRRDGPSLHRQLAALDGGSPAFGTHLAIVAGDLLFAATMRLLHHLDVPGDAYRDVLRLFSRVACLTGFGQAADIVHAHAPPALVPADADERALLCGYLWKTAAYTFEGPMLSGAILAGLGPAAQAALSRFALALGQAYQLQNDLADLRSAAHAGCDLVQGKRTVTLLRARSAMSAADRRRFDQRWAEMRTANGRAVALAEGLRRELLDRGAAEQTAELIRSLLADAGAAADDPAVGGRLGRGLACLLDSLEVGYFVGAHGRALASAGADPSRDEVLPASRP